MSVVDTNIKCPQCGHACTKSFDCRECSSETGCRFCGYYTSYRFEGGSWAWVSLPGYGVVSFQSSTHPHVVSSMPCNSEKEFAEAMTAFDGAQPFAWGRAMRWNPETGSLDVVREVISEGFAIPVFMDPILADEELETEGCNSNVFIDTDGVAPLSEPQTLMF